MDQDAQSDVSNTDAQPAPEGSPRAPKESPAETLARIQARWQGSKQFNVIEWLKALAGVAAVLGLIVTAIFYARQLAQLNASRDDERFDKAVARLSGQNPSERLTGLTGLQLFLEPSQHDRHRAALLFLANAVAVEKDVTVRGAMLDTFASLAAYRIDQQVLNSTLGVERDRNRGVLKSLQGRFHARLRENSAVIFEKGNDEVGLGNLEPEDMAPLQATATAIASLVRSGAYLQDLSEIYCVSCVFSSNDRHVNLSNTNFNRSFLQKASFAKVTQENASFDGSDLRQTDFTAADMRKARLTDPPLIEPAVQAVLVQKALWGVYGPIFECADLTEADFTGSVMFGFYWTDINGAGYFPSFFGANLSHAKLRSFTIFTAIPTDVAALNTVPHKLASDVLPIKYGQAGGYGNIDVEGWNKKHYLITSYQVGDDFQITGPIPSDLWRSMYSGLNSFASAKNLADAEMPEGLRAFISANQAVLARPIISTTCPAANGFPTAH